MVLFFVNGIPNYTNYGFIIYTQYTHTHRNARSKMIKMEHTRSTDPNGSPAAIRVQPRRPRRSPRSPCGLGPSVCNPGGRIPTVTGDRGWDFDRFFSRHLTTVTRRCALLRAAGGRGPAGWPRARPGNQSPPSHPEHLAATVILLTDQHTLGRSQRPRVRGPGQP